MAPQDKKDESLYGAIVAFVLFVFAMIVILIAALLTPWLPGI